MPESLRGTYGEYSKNFGFNWKEFVMGIPTPMFLVTTYKSNGQPNATMQSWAGFASANHGGGYYAILSSVNKRGHLYQSLNDKKDAELAEKLKAYKESLSDEEKDALIADSTVAGHLLPLPVRSQYFHFEGGDALAQRDVLLQHDTVEGALLRQGKGKRRGENIVRNGPVAVVILVQQRTFREGLAAGKDMTEWLM